MNILAINWGNAFEVIVYVLGMVFIILLLLVGIVFLFNKLRGPKAPVVKDTCQAAPVVVPEIKKEEVQKVVETEFEKGSGISANEGAAIAMALHQFYAEVHDVESLIMTIKTVERRYSPWSSKIYGLNNLVR